MKGIGVETSDRDFFRVVIRARNNSDCVPEDRYVLDSESARLCSSCAQWFQRHEGTRHQRDARQHQQQDTDQKGTCLSKHLFVCRLCFVLCNTNPILLGNVDNYRSEDI